MERYEYICLSINIIPKEILTQYNLRTMDKNGYFYAGIIKLMYSLPQSERIAKHFFTKNISPYDYYQCQNTPGLWRQKWSPVTSSLAVDYFGLNYHGKNHTEHLITCIKNIIQCQLIGQGGYTVESVFNVTINKDM